ncbi:MAG: deoxyribose-phosphate aldolase [Planctomycetota bacterium]
MNLAPLIDHTILRPDADDAALAGLAAECVEHGFFSACAHSRHVPLLARELAGTDVKITSIAGFPLGAAHQTVKAREAGICVELGAHEVDMVLSVGDLVSGETARVEADIRAVRDAIPDAVLKVILECGLLTDDQKREAARITMAAGADFVKTSTGFGHGGATVEDVRLLREVVGPDYGVKASAGIRTRDQALALVEAGASRLGTSAGVAIAG